MSVHELPNTLIKSSFEVAKFNAYFSTTSLQYNYSLFLLKYESFDKINDSIQLHFLTVLCIVFSLDISMYFNLRKIFSSHFYNNPFI